jgi:hypothetical protein
MKTPIVFALSAILAFAAFLLPAVAVDRTCRPSLSNLWKCPDTSVSPRKSARPVDRTCRPSLSNGYKCPDTSVSSAQTKHTPAASNDTRKATPRKGATTVDRTCRPSLSNLWKCPGTSASPAQPTGAGQFTTEAQAKAHCAGDTVVWANTSSKIYHFSGTWNYGNTKYGAYMCETDSVSAGMRAAKNETHP